MTDLLVARVNPNQQTDLRSLLRNLGGTVQAADHSQTDPRRMTEADVEILDDKPAPLTGDGADVTAWVDGTQKAAVIGWREGRPLTLAHLAAGAVTSAGEAVGLSEELRLLVSAVDAEYVRARAGDIGVTELPEQSPPDVEYAAGENIRSIRDSLERNLSNDLLDRADGLIVCDGTLVARDRPDHRLVTVAKTQTRRYLEDESGVWTLPAGWRSQTFKITHEGTQPRYSCYVRLWDPAGQRWSFALIRVETYTYELLEPFAVTCFQHRQTATTGDRRWDRHLYPIAACEAVLRSRRPQVFDLVDDL